MKIFDIWKIEFNEIPLSTELINIISKEEHEKAKKFFKKIDYTSYIITHAYLRIILTNYYKHVKPNDWKFKKNMYGKPQISNNHDISLYFNLSHTASCVYMIFSSYKQCGIDVEDKKNIDLDDNMLDLVFSEYEKKYFLNKNKNLSLFYTYWTLKESYVKAIGEGFNIDPKEVDFKNKVNIDTNKIYFTIDEKDHYFVHNFNDKLFLSYAILDAKEKELKPKFYEISDLDKTISEKGTLHG